MKRNILLLAALLVPLSLASTFADDAHKGHAAAAKADAAKKTITGEVVDMGCYLAHGARGEKHASCGTKCIEQGMPMGLLTDKGALYLITLNHDDPEPYNTLKSMAGKSVSVTGTVMTRNGVKAIDVTAVQAS